MPKYYCLACPDDKADVQVGNLGDTVPAGTIPARKPDFPVFKIPFAEEVRIDIFNRLFANWSVQMQMPVLVQVADDGTMECWLDDSE